MTCPVCGKAQPCVHSRSNAAVALDAGALPSPREVESRADQVYWRQEIVTRVQQHRARRRRRFDADASLELDFPAQDTVAEEASPPAALENPPNLPVARVDRNEVAVAGDRLSRSVAPLPAEPKIIR